MAEEAEAVSGASGSSAGPNANHSSDVSGVSCGEEMWSSSCDGNLSRSTCDVDNECVWYAATFSCSRISVGYCWDVC